MAAAMNGMALHGGVIPYGGTFLVFTDYCRPAIRLAALMGMPRHLRDDARFDRPRRGRPDPPAGRASGRAARHPQPARLPPGRRGRDRRMLAAGAASAPTARRVLALTRQNLPALRTELADGEPLRPRRLRDSPRPTATPTSTIFATGSEVEIADRRAGAARGQGHRRPRRLGALARAVPAAAGRRTAPRSSATRRSSVAIEAGGRAWAGTRCIGDDGIFVGMNGFGASAPYRGALRAFRHHRRGGRRRPSRDAAVRTALDRRSGERHMAVGLPSTASAASAATSCAPSSSRAARTSRSSAINDLGPVETNAHLLRYDSVHGRFPAQVKVDGDTIDVGRGPIKVTAIKDPAELPHKELGVDIALECTGIFTSKEKAAAHLTGRRQARAGLGPGRRRRPHRRLRRQPRQADARTTSSSPTPPAPPTASRRWPRCCNDAVGIEHGFMTTIHSYTGDQPTLDTHAQGSLPRPRRGAEHDPDLDRRRQGDRPGACRN